MSELTTWLDTREVIGPAKWWRPVRLRGGNRPGNPPDRPRLIVVHDMEASESIDRARSTAAWVRDSGGDAQVSCHFTTDDVNAIRIVPDEATAFTQGSPWNDMSLSIEQTGFAAQSLAEWRDAYSEAQRHVVARIIAAWCERWQIPPVLRLADELLDWQHVTGITTHAQLSRASQDPSMKALGYTPMDHTDPGPNFPIDLLLNEVQSILAGAPIITTPTTPSTGDAEMAQLYAMPAAPDLEGGVVIRGDSTEARRVNSFELDTLVARYGNVITLDAVAHPEHETIVFWLQREIRGYERRNPTL